mgnify:CR=1 FL=1
MGAAGAAGAVGAAAGAAAGGTSAAGAAGEAEVQAEQWQLGVLGRLLASEMSPWDVKLRRTTTRMGRVAADARKNGFPSALLRRAFGPQPSDVSVSSASRAASGAASGAASRAASGAASLESPQCCAASGAAGATPAAARPAFTPHLLDAIAAAAGAHPAPLIALPAGEGGYVELVDPAESEPERVLRNVDPPSDCEMWIPPLTAKCGSPL